MSGANPGADLSSAAFRLTLNDLGLVNTATLYGMEAMICQTES